MEITRGRTEIRRGTLLLNGTATAPGVSSDTIFAVKWNAAKPDTELLFTCRVGDGIEYSGGTGEFTLTISKAKTELLPAAAERLVLTYELLYSLPPEAYQLQSGVLYVKPSVLQTI